MSHPSPPDHVLPTQLSPASHSPKLAPLSAPTVFPPSPFGSSHPFASPTAPPTPAPSKPHVLLGLTGSVASLKVMELIQQMSEFASVQVVTSARAQHFYDLAAVQQIVPVHLDEHEWKTFQRGEPVLHIELRRWADVFVIAPLSANTLAKLANGICDNLLVSEEEEEEQGADNNSKTMNTFMYNHPFTSPHLSTLRSLGIRVIDPISKTLVCGDVGIGAMASVDTIVQAVKKATMQRSRLAAAVAALTQPWQQRQDADKEDEEDEEDEEEEDEEEEEVEEKQEEEKKPEERRQDASPVPARPATASGSAQSSISAFSRSTH